MPANEISMDTQNLINSINDGPWMDEDEDFDSFDENENDNPEFYTDEEECKFLYKLLLYFSILISITISRSIAKCCRIYG